MDILKNILIFSIIFFVILLFQNNDDKLLGKPKRDSLYNKIKLPLLVSLMTILIINFDFNECKNLMILLTPPKNLNNIIPNVKNNVLNDIYLSQPDF